MKKKQMVSVILGCLAVILVSLHITFLYRATAPVMEANDISDIIDADIFAYTENVLASSTCVEKNGRYGSYEVKLKFYFIDATSYRFTVNSTKCNQLSNLLVSGKRQKVEIYKIASGWYSYPVLIRVGGKDIFPFETNKKGFSVVRRSVVYMILGWILGVTFWFFAKKHRERMDEMIKKHKAKINGVRLD